MFLHKIQSLGFHLLFIFLILSIATCFAQDPFGEHTYPETIETADRLALIAPATVLEVGLDGEASDLLEFITPNLLLAGVIVVDRNSAPDYGPVYLIDTVTGEVKWEYEREDLSGGSYSLICTEPLIVLLGAEESSVKLTALNPESGRKVWDEEFDTPFGLSGTSDRNWLVVASKDGSTFSLNVIDLPTGNSVLETNLPSDAFEGVSHIPVYVLETSVLLVGRSVVEAGLSDGAVSRTLNLPVESPDPSSTIILTNGILAWDSREVKLIDRASGEVLWVHSADRTPIQNVSVSFGRTVLVLGSEQSVMCMLDTDSGQRLWSHSIAGKLVSPLAAEENLLLYTTDSTVTGVRASDGSTAFITELPSGMTGGSPTFAEIMGLPDVMYSEEGVLFVARERSGIAAFDLPGGMLRWYHAHYSAGLPLINYTADGRYASVYANMIEMGQLSATEPFQPPPSLSSVNPDGSSQLLTVAQQRYDHARARYDSEQGSSLDVQIAAGGQIAAVQMDMFSGQLTAGLELAQSIVNFGAALREFQRAQGRQGVIDRMELALQGAQRAQENLFQSGYYLRPFYYEMWGRGVTLVEISTGLRRDIIFSPHNPPALAYGLDMPTFIIDPDGEQLAVFGISLNTDRYERRSRWGTHIPDYSVLKYDLDALEFFDHPTVFPSLEAAITNADIEQFDWLLERGRDAGILEWTNHAGETPIFFAVVMGMPDILQLLIDSGADVNVVCDAGMTPIELAGFSRETRDILLAAGARTASGEIPEVTELNGIELPPLLMAVCSNQTGEVRRLIDSGEDINWRGENGYTVLFIAVAIGDPEMVRLLLDCGADVNTVGDDGNTLLDLAFSEEIRSMLIDAGAGP